MKYVIYCIIGILVVWSVFYLARRIYQMIRGGSCDGCCDSCCHDCSASKKKKRRRRKPPSKPE